MGTLLVVCGLMLHQLSLCAMPCDSSNRRRRLRVRNPFTGKEHDDVFKSSWFEGRRRDEFKYGAALCYDLEYVPAKDCAEYVQKDLTWFKVEEIPKSQVPDDVTAKIEKELRAKVVAKKNQRCTCVRCGMQNALEI